MVNNLIYYNLGLISSFLDFTAGFISFLLALDTILIFIILSQVSKLFRKEAVKKETTAEVKTTWWQLFDRESTIPDQVMKDHNYDGIREYDNNPPAWFNWLFYLSIFWGIIYFSYYHVFKLGDLQYEQYAKQMEKAKILYAGSEATKAINYDEVAPLTKESAIASGKQIFLSNCAACHLATAGGSTGPNLTDEYWIHGGQFKDIVRTISEGVPAKGMLTWKGRLTNEEILKVASYVQSIRGTNVEGGKAPQGEKYEGAVKGNDNKNNNKKQEETGDSEV